jgi:hypothetical protein
MNTAHRGAVLAQTNLQLYRQLAAQGWDAQGLAEVDNAYRHACRWFSGQYRPSGKPFVDHLVGTASAVGFETDRPPLVAAAVTHAAYQSGDLGPGIAHRSERARSLVRCALGHEVELLVAAYDAFDWFPDGLEQCLETPATLTPERRDLCLLRLANEWDDWVDSGMAVCGKQVGAEHTPDTVGRMQELAIALGYGSVAAGLADQLDEWGTADEWATTVRRTDDHSSVVVPPSLRRRVDVRAVARSIPRPGRIARALRRRLARLRARLCDRLPARLLVRR